MFGWQLRRSFRATFVQSFNGDMQQWPEEVPKQAHLLTQEPGSLCPGPSELGTTPLPLFARTKMWVTAAPIHLEDAADVGNSDAGGYRSRRGAEGEEGGASGVGAAVGRGGAAWGEGLYDRPCRDCTEYGSCLHEPNNNVPWRYRHPHSVKIA